MFNLWALPKFITKERKEVLEWTIQYGIHHMLKVLGIWCPIVGRDEDEWKWCFVDLRHCSSLGAGTLTWLQDWFPTSIISTWDERFHGSDFDSSLKGNKIGWSWTSSFDLSRWALGVEVNRGLPSVWYSMFLSTRHRPDFKGTSSDAPGLLGSNTGVVLT